MRYFELIDGTYWSESFKQGVIYPENKIDEYGFKTVLYYATTSIFSQDWQERTEAEYLEQQDLLDELNRHVDGGMKAIQNKQADYLAQENRGEPFVSKCCIGEKCSVCGKSATNKVSEVLLIDDPNPNRHELTAYVCKEHFVMIFGKINQPPRNDAGN